MVPDLLKLSPRITVLPIIHGSGDFAIAVRQVMLEGKYDCLAVPLPPSFQSRVEEAIGHLPAITLVVQEEPRDFGSPESWSPESEREQNSGGPSLAASY